MHNNFIDYIAFCKILLELKIIGLLHNLWRKI